MRGLQLQEARQKRRMELRRAASVAGFGGGDFLALDEEELIRRADLADVGAQGNAVKRRLVLEALAHVRGGDAAVAEAWHTTAAELARLRKVPMLDASGIAAAIDARVLEEHPETPEPGRAVAPQV